MGKGNNWWPNTTSDERGKQAEENFFKAWEDPVAFPEWLVSVSTPTSYEDFRQKTDAVMVRIAGPNLRLQIKSYYLKNLERTEFMEYGVIPISIRGCDTAVDIRRKTHRALKNFDDYLVQSKLDRKRIFSKNIERWRPRRKKS